MKGWEMLSSYYDKMRVRFSVLAGQHRKLIGGLWSELGALQLDYLKAEGLLPHHRLIDIGCGALRGGVRFVDYLESGHYFGTDLNRTLLDAGYREIRRSGLADKLPRANLLKSAEFDFDSYDAPFDYAIAQSLFSHLPINFWRVCLERLAPAMRPGGLFFATFFVCDGESAGRRIRHEPGGIETGYLGDPYHYRESDIRYCCDGLPWVLDYVRDWAHPRGQRMARLTRQA